MPEMSIFIQLIPALKPFTIDNLRQAYALLRQELQTGGHPENYRVEQHTVHYGYVFLRLSAHGYQYEDIEMVSAICALRAMDTFVRVLENNCRLLSGVICMSSRFWIEMTDALGATLYLGRGDATYSRPQSSQK